MPNYNTLALLLLIILFFLQCQINYILVISRPNRFTTKLPLSSFLIRSWPLSIRARRARREPAQTPRVFIFTQPRPKAGSRVSIRQAICKYVDARVLSVVTWKRPNQSNKELHNERTVCWCNQSQYWGTASYESLKIRWPRKCRVTEAWKLNLRVVWSSQF